MNLTDLMPESSKYSICIVEHLWAVLYPRNWDINYNGLLYHGAPIRVSF